MAIFFQQAGRYIVVGVLNTVIGLTCIFAGLFFLNLTDITANIFGYATGFLFSYFLHRIWTFRHTGVIKKTLPRFAFVVAGAYVCNLITVVTIHRVMEINVYIAQISGVLVYTIVGFLGSRHFAFSQNIK